MATEIEDIDEDEEDYTPWNERTRSQKIKDGLMIGALTIGCAASFGACCWGVNQAAKAVTKLAHQIEFNLSNLKQNDMQNITLPQEK